jgi:hypothetical protein
MRLNRSKQKSQATGTIDEAVTGYLEELRRRVARGASDESKQVKFCAR